MLPHCLDLSQVIFDFDHQQLALQLYLSNHKTAVKFAAIKTLNKLAMNHAEVVATCNMDMEALITDSNRSIATLAITTLLKVF